MFFISHRGNIDSVKEDFENSIPYIENAMSLGYDVEIDLRMHKDKLYLGHDEPDHPVKIEWLVANKDKLWIHTKDISSLDLCTNTSLRYFFHEKERHTLISNGLIWTHDLREATKKSIIPWISIKISKEDFDSYSYVKGVCSDFIKHYRELSVY